MEKPKYSIHKLDSLDFPGCVKKLPTLCQAIYNRGNQKLCPKVVGRAKDLLSKFNGSPFVFCCSSAAKVLVIPTTDNNAYLVHSRSPFCDRKHLEQVAAQIELDVDDVIKEWKKLDEFSGEFIEHVLRDRDIDTSIISDDVKKKTLNIGQTYDHFIFDIAVYDALLELSPPPKNKGMLAIEASYKLKSHSLTRVITEDFREDAGLNPSLPIIGFVLEREATRNYTDLVSSILFDEDNPLKEKEDIGEFIEIPWHVKGTYYFDEGEIDKSWLKSTTEAITVGVYYGIGNAPEFLIKKLQSEGKEEFLDWLINFSNNNILPKAPDGNSILWQYLTKEISECIEQLDSHNWQLASRTKCDFFKEILSLVKSDSTRLMTVRVLRNGEVRNNRKKLLIDALQNKEKPALGGFSYINMIEGDISAYLLNDLLNKHDYTKQYLKTHLSKNLKGTIVSLLGKLDDYQMFPSKDKGRVLWKDVLDICDHNQGCQDYSDVKILVEEELYNREAPPLTRFKDDFLSALKGSVCQTVTLGLKSGNPITHKSLIKKRNNYIRKSVLK